MQDDRRRKVKSGGEGCTIPLRETLGAALTIYLHDTHAISRNPMQLPHISSMHLIDIIDQKGKFRGVGDTPATWLRRYPDNLRV